MVSFKSLCGFALLMPAVGLLSCSAAQQQQQQQPEVGDTLVVEAVDWRTNQPVDLAQLRGKVTLVELWASWCIPCAKAMVHHGALYRRLQSKGMRVLAISLDEDKQALTQFLAGHEVPFSVAWDEGQKTAERLRPPKMPTSYVIDADGKILGIQGGGDDAALRAISELVEAAIEKP